MVKLWTGIERENIDEASKLPTLFVCSDNILTAEFIINYLKTLEVKAIYFGAGRLPFFGFIERDWNKILEYCTETDVKILIEVEPDKFHTIISKYNNPIVHFIVAYYNVPKGINDIYFKTDDLEVVRLFTCSTKVDISSVRDNRYTEDILIYEED